MPKMTIEELNQKLSFTNLSFKLSADGKSYIMDCDGEDINLTPREIGIELETSLNAMNLAKFMVDKNRYPRCEFQLPSGGQVFAGKLIAYLHDRPVVMDSEGTLFSSITGRSFKITDEEWV